MTDPRFDACKDSLDDLNRRMDAIDEPTARAAYMEANDAYYKMIVIERSRRLSREEKAEFRHLKEARDKARDIWDKTTGGG